MLFWKKLRLYASHSAGSMDPVGDIPSVRMTCESKAQRDNMSERTISGHVNRLALRLGKLQAHRSYAHESRCSARANASLLSFLFSLLHHVNEPGSYSANVAPDLCTRNQNEPSGQEERVSACRSMHRYL